MLRRNRRALLAAVACTGAVVPVTWGPSARAATASIGPSVLVRPPADAAAAPVASFDAIACGSSTVCVAVGRYEAASARGLPFAATMTARGWSRAVSVAPPAGRAGAHSTAGLAAVACPSATACVAVGSYVDAAGNERPMVANELAGTWSAAVPVALPAAAAATNEQAQLDAVSCAAVGSCVAAGVYTTATGAVRLMAATSIAGSWGAAVSIALPADAGSVPRTPGAVALSGISCAATTDCVAVGDYLDAAGGYAPIHVTLTAGAWGQARRVHVALRARLVSTADLAAVSCATPTACVAVGGAANLAGRPVEIAAAQAAGGWGVAVASGRLPATQPHLLGARLDGVTCPAVGSCLAVGAATTATGQTVALVRDQHVQWALSQEVRAPRAFGPATSALLRAVACVQATRCVAVGSVTTTSRSGTVIDARPFATLLTL